MIFKITKVIMENSTMFPNSEQLVIASKILRNIEKAGMLPPAEHGYNWEDEDVSPKGV